MNGVNKPQEYCGAERGHIPHDNGDTVCGGYPPSNGGMAAAPFPDTDGAAGPKIMTWPTAADTSEWWFTLRHGSPELNCPQTGKSWALQNQVTGGLVPLPPLMMCISCGTALTLVDNGPTPPAGEDVKVEGAGPV